MSSGSTNNPKGIVHSYNTLRADKSAMKLSIGLMTNLMFHVGGFLIPLYCGLIHSNSTCFLKDFSIEKCADAIESYEPSMVYLGVSQYIKFSSATEDEKAGLFASYLMNKLIEKRAYCPIGLDICKNTINV